MATLIHNGRLITADRDFDADILIEGETISAVGPNLRLPADSVIDANGRFVIPGGIDVHTHLDASVGGTVSSDNFESGTRAAAFGGTTCIIDFAQQEQGKSMIEARDMWLKKAEKAVIDFGLHMSIVDAGEERLDELDELVILGVTSFKLFMAYPGTLMVDDATALRVLRRAAQIGALTCVHAENGAVIDDLVRAAISEGKTDPIYHAFTRPPLTESEAVQRAIALAEQASAPLYVVHVTSEPSLKIIAQARRRGLPVFAETCPHYLLLTTDELRREGFEGAKYVLTPPLREKHHLAALWQGLRDRDLDVVSTDHCPFNFKGQKDLGRYRFDRIPNGGPGIEHRLELLYHFGVNEERISLKRWVELVSTAPAKLFGLYPQKGTIAVDSDADIVIWNPNKEHTISAATHHMNVDYSMYEGFTVKGAVETVFSRGEVILDHGRWLGAPGRGRYIERKPFNLLELSPSFS